MSEYLNGIKAVLLDHDDTLVDTKGPKIRQHKFIAGEYYGVDLKDDFVRLHWGKPLTQLISLYYRTNDVDTAFDRIKDHYDDYRKELFPYTVPALVSLKDLGLITGIVTSTTRNIFDYDLSYLGIDPALIDYTQTVDETPHHKPDPRVFKPALEWLVGHGVEAEAVLYIGDGLQDGFAARDAGLKFLGVQTGFIDEMSFAQHGFASVKNLGEILTGKV